jgi:hypothetical protein
MPAKTDGARTSTPSPHHLGIAWRETGDYQGAAGDLEQAMAVYRDLGDRGGEVTALNESGGSARADAPRSIYARVTKADYSASRR